MLTRLLDKLRIAEGLAAECLCTLGHALFPAEQFAMPRVTVPSDWPRILIIPRGDPTLTSISEGVNHMAYSTHESPIINQQFFSCCLSYPIG